VFCEVSLKFHDNFLQISDIQRKIFFECRSTNLALLSCSTLLSTICVFLRFLLFFWFCFLLGVRWLVFLANNNNIKIYFVVYPSAMKCFAKSCLFAFPGSEEHIRYAVGTEHRLWINKICRLLQLNVSVVSGIDIRSRYK
jgi:hypothetical protein